MKNFKQLIKELPSKKVVFAFGRFQPPTTGHELLVKAVKKLAGSTADHVIYASKSEDKKSNPLPVARKVYFLKRMFPKTNFVAANAEVRTFIEAAKELNKKYKDIVMVAGSDRVAEYTRILNTYNGKDFNFDTIEVVSAGERDPDTETLIRLSKIFDCSIDYILGLTQGKDIISTRAKVNDIVEYYNLTKELNIEEIKALSEIKKNGHSLVDVNNVLKTILKNK
jgi:nicotinic acid mononucleotide adenylyltransferase